MQVYQDEDGQLKKTKFVPPKNPNEDKNAGDAQSLVTASLLADQKKSSDYYTKKQEDVYGGASFQQTGLLQGSGDDGDALSFKPQMIQ